MDVEQYYFVHDPIDLGGPAFRLLRILKENGRGICCELFQAWVRQREVAISYEALSYVWGSPVSECSIEINGKRFLITKNLYEALQQLVLPDQDRVVWIDAICIDQTNKAEQGHQVEHMGDIYKEAAQVLYWLGPSTNYTETCFDALRALQDEAKKHPYNSWTREQWEQSWKSINEKRPYTDLAAEGLLQLMARPWFRRIWILQEVANSRAAAVLCGKDSVSARVFAIAPHLMGLTTETHVQAALDMMPGLKKESWFNQKKDLYTLIQKFGTCEATEPRDLVYALLGIATDATGDGGIKPDYNKTEQEVAETVFEFLFHVKFVRTELIGSCTVETLCRKLQLYTTVALDLAVNNLEADRKTLIHILTAYPTVDISSSIWRYVKEKRQKGYDLLKILLQYASPQKLRDLAPNFMQAAAGNKSSGSEMVKTLLDSSQMLSGRIHQAMVTEEAIVAAASNDGCGDEITAQFCKHGGRQKVTKAVFGSAMANSNPRMGLKVLDLLLTNSEEDGAMSQKTEHPRPTFDTIDIPTDLNTEQELCNKRHESDTLLQTLLRLVPTKDASKERLVLRPFDETGATELIRLLFRHVAGTGVVEGIDMISLVLRRAIRDGSMPVIRCLMSATEALTEVVEYSSAARILLEQVAQMRLLKHGADLEAANSGGYTLLLLAVVSCSNSGLVELLLSHGANTDAFDLLGQTPLSIAALWGDSSTVELLILHGANTQAVDLERRTPLHLAVKSGDHSSTERLFCHGVDIEAVDHIGRTPLSLAASDTSSDGEVVKLLLSYGADINTRCHENKRPLDWVVENKGGAALRRSLMDAERARGVETAGGQ
ncbi:hypothetical protein QBC34DRAFT_385242 [Podospora aff. communis PSN243]|uniref:Heterokaryon incompatibility domain-containing protein n=1 Tax=Podospora aff. communis PSN243 TaxID=3040156 RepID=A0AAV9GAI1_9PEZI|nr:hypothetical protein QBC34DRAFT_385242 [Podospora aff. communis PSN243]